MKSSGWDKSAWTEVFGKLRLELAPVAVSFSIKAPEGVKRLEDHISLCEMLPRAQHGDAFYAAPENHACDAGLYIIGKSVPPAFTGEYGAGIQVFNHPRACGRLYDAIPRLDPGRNISYITFSPLEKLAFEPDLLVVVVEVEQAEILLRAMSYSTGKPWTSTTSSVMGCAWIYIYPYLTGDLNYVTTGLSHGMRRRKALPPGRQLLTIPYDLFPMMLQNLQTMPWVTPLFQPGADEFRKKLLTNIGLDSDLMEVKARP